MTTTNFIFRRGMGIAALMFVLALPMVFNSCHPSEKTYRAAYLKAKEKRLAAEGNNKGYVAAKSFEPEILTVDTFKVMGRGMFLTPVDVEGLKESQVKKFSVVVARFMQIFNASSMGKRLADNGFADAWVGRYRDDSYFVVAYTTDTLENTFPILDSLQVKGIPMKPPFPFTAIKP